MDGIPVFVSTSMIFNIICGLVLLGEADRYKTSHLIGISFSVIVTIFGIFVLGYKKTYIAEGDKQKTKGEGEQEDEQLLDTSIESAQDNAVVSTSMNKHRRKLLEILCEHNATPQAVKTSTTPSDAVQGELDQQVKD